MTEDQTARTVVPAAQFEALLSELDEPPRVVPELLDLVRRVEG